MIKLDRFKDGKRHCLTFSYDDGRIYDERLTEIFNRYGMKGTFHLNSALLGHEGYVRREQLHDLYAGHEISCHSATHPFPDLIPAAEWMRELWMDREILESEAGYAVRGMSYPFGIYNPSVIETAKSCGIVYSRTVKSTRQFNLPNDFMKWHPTCHHSECMSCSEQFFSQWAYENKTQLFYVWGHSYEFERESNWSLIEEFCKRMSGNEDIWYAANIEIYDYIQGLRRLQITADGKTVHNPSAQELWFSNDGAAVKIGGGETIKL